MACTPWSARSIATANSCVACRRSVTSDLLLRLANHKNPENIGLLRCYASIPGPGGRKTSHARASLFASVGETRQHCSRRREEAHFPSLPLRERLDGLGRPVGGAVPPSIRCCGLTIAVVKHSFTA